MNDECASSAAIWILSEKVGIAHMSSSWALSASTRSPAPISRSLRAVSASTSITDTPRCGRGSTRAARGRDLQSLQRGHRHACPRGHSWRLRPWGGEGDEARQPILDRSEARERDPVVPREQIREELTWGVATLSAAPLCLSILPLVLLFAVGARLGQKNRLC